jgi:hypothetical protein
MTQLKFWLVKVGMNDNSDFRQNIAPYPAPGKHLNEYRQIPGISGRLDRNGGSSTAGGNDTRRELRDRREKLATIGRLNLWQTLACGLLLGPALAAVVLKVGRIITKSR